MASSGAVRAPASALALIALVACAGPDDDPVAPPPVVGEDGRVRALRCPGDPSCAQTSGDLSVGVHAVDITPGVETFEDLDDNGRWDPGEPLQDLDGDGEHDEVWIAGFSMGRPARGVHDPLWARALAFEQGDLQVAIVALDLVGFFHDDVLAVRARVRERGLLLDHLAVVSTHNHEGPDAMGIWGPDLSQSGRDPEYLERVVDAAAEAVLRAFEGRRPMSFTYAQVDVPELVHDSRLPEVKDALATAVRFEDADGPAAVLAVWGNHPEALGGRHQEITSDYPHYLRETIEAAYPGATAVFVPGNLGGLMNPLSVPGCPDADGNPTCATGTYEKAAYIGEGAANAMLEALAGPEAKTVERPDLRAALEPIDVVPDNLVFMAAWSAGLFERRLFGSDRALLPRPRAERITFAEIQQGALQFQSEVGAIGLGPLELVTIPGELYPELWLTGPGGESLIEQPEGADYPDAALEPALSTLVPEGRVPVALNQTNDSLGYFIPEAQFDRARPRAYEPDGQYGEQNSVGPKAPGVIAEGVRRLYE